MTSPSELLDQLIPYEPQPSRERVWSPWQSAIFEAVSRKSDDLLIQAVAGSGKTTTIIKAMDFAGDRPLFMAFNKAIAEDIRQRAPRGEVKTLNALGHRMMLQMRPLAKLDAKKTLNHLKRIMGEDSYDYKDFAYTLSRVVGLAKNQGLRPGEVLGDPALLEDIIDNYQLDIPADRAQDLARVAARCLAEGAQDEATFDFDDQLWVPVTEGWAFDSFSDVFVDECQDLSTIQHMMLEALKARGARLIAVGDRHQAIYGFRGALTDSMDQLRKQFNMLELPLSVSYRCPTKVIDEAQVLCPHIQARDGAPSGEVNFADSDPELFPQAMIICRNNAPLFKAVLGHVRARSPCRVMSNFLESFQGFVRSFKCKETRQLLPKLEIWLERETAAAERKGFKGKVYGIRDKYETVKLLCQDYQTVDEVINLVKRLADGRSGPVFSTVHKAKGLEHPNVYILRPDLIPAFYATTPEQRQQENNLLYVAITRSQDRLTYGEMQK